MTAASGRSTAPVDLGLQPERTHLAWRRTRLALIVSALVVARHALLAGGPARQAAVAGTIALVAVLAAHRSPRRRMMATAAAAVVVALAETASLLLR